MAVYRASHVAGRPYIVGEWVSGHSLDQGPKPIEDRRVLAVALGLARGLAAVHQRGVLHHDRTNKHKFCLHNGDIADC